MTMQSITTHDGRTVTYQLFGATDGPLVVHAHGGGSSRLEAWTFDAAAREQGLRVVGIDRPAVGGSSPQPGRTLLGWADDVVAVADALEADRFVVSGVSAGGPHALAVGHALPDRVIAVAPINSGVPGDEPEWLAGGPLSTRLMMRLMTRSESLCRRVMAVGQAIGGRGQGMADPKTLSRFLSRLPEPDQRAFSDPQRREMLKATIEAGNAQGNGALVEDVVLLYSRHWGFDPYGLKVPVEAFAGTEDLSGPFAEKLARTSAEGRLHSFPGGHYAFAAPEAALQICTILRERCDADD